MPEQPKVIIFDVNETLLDLETMRESVGAALNGRQELLPLWFSTMLHHSLKEHATLLPRPFADPCYNEKASRTTATRKPSEFHEEEHLLGGGTMKRLPLLPQLLSLSY